ncbi:adenylyl-sulfate kinase [Bordetella bronchialis]|uniref:Adenylyl-sulfate kinase n=1 Tax=Bordetella bronchialis TaxID=463025 RepID=A0ABM6CY18_9BORD|nr:adenylyl-sulfate kinase [Bordetella bronchialis]ANN69080.1 adenylyl-sulfate kinase [Bordetella bronchialis]
MVIWFVGLSGSGKTTLGREVKRQWAKAQPNTVLLDGDELRAVFQHDRTADAYSVSGRRLNAERIAALCEMLDRQGINVVCCMLAIFPDMLALNRTRFRKYFEVFMDAPLEALQRRDVKGLYAAARAGTTPNVVGIDIPFPRPASPDMIIDSSGECGDIAALAARVLATARAL